MRGQEFDHPDPCIGVGLRVVPEPHPEQRPVRKTQVERRRFPNMGFLRN